MKCRGPAAARNATTAENAPPLPVSHVEGPSQYRSRRRRPLKCVEIAARKWAREIRCTECKRIAWIVRAVREQFNAHGWTASEFCCDWFREAETGLLFDLQEED